MALARREQWTWGRIARLLGRKRQSVHERFRNLQPSIRSSPEIRERHDDDHFTALLNWSQRRQWQDSDDVVAW